MSVIELPQEITEFVEYSNLDEYLDLFDEDKIYHIYVLGSQTAECGSSREADRHSKVCGHKLFWPGGRRESVAAGRCPQCGALPCPFCKFKIEEGLKGN